MNYSECNYWTEILKGYEEDIQNKDLTHSKYNLTPTFSDSEVLKLIKLILNQGKIWNENTIYQYGLKNYYLFKNVLNYTKNEIILDSSKKWSRLLMLDLSGFFDIKVIYLFRDGRANIESVKRKAHDPKREHADYKGPFIHTIQFELSHLQRLRILKNLKNSDVRIITYKGLTSQIENKIKDLCNFIGIDFNDETLHPNSEYYFSNFEKHNVGGNRLRFKKVNTIQFIEKWPKGLNNSEKLIFNCLGGPIFNNFFYKFEDGKRNY